jgi:hypothetical protein
MVSEDDEVTRLQHVAEMLYGLVGSQQLPTVSAFFFYCAGLSFSGCQALSIRCCSTAPMAEVKASVTSAS